MGAPLDIASAEQISAEYTSTASIFAIHADDKVSIKVTFLSPLTPSDLKRQSLVFSYMKVEVASIDGSDHEVQLYTDISAEWVSGNRNSKAEWSYGTAPDGISYHKVWKQEQLVFHEYEDRGEWGNIYYATDSGHGYTYQSGADRDVRGNFTSSGKLSNSKDTNFRAINDRWPVFAFAIDLGSVDSEATSNLFSIGLCQDPAIQFLGKDGLRNVPSLWKDYFKDDVSVLSFFHKDYSESSQLSAELDAKIAEDSTNAGGDNYALMTTLAARQAFGATQLVGTKDKHYMFLKEISSNGNTQTVDVIYPASPIFLYTNPELLKLMLDPHFENQENGHYPHLSAIHDLGSNYPNATGHTDGKDEEMPVEECGNHMFMVLAYVQYTGNTDYIKDHYPILKQWVEFLVQFSLIPAEQWSTDDFAGKLTNQTNLALKGVLGIEAMSRMSEIIGETDDAQSYTEIAHDYITKWQEYGMNMADDPKHSMLQYNNPASHGLLYNLYNDRLLGLNIVPQEIYDIQSDFYPTVREMYGVPLDTRHDYTKTDWEIFCAAIASDSTKKMFIDDVASWINETPSNKPFSDLYGAAKGEQPTSGIDFKARPVVGGIFALLLLDSEGYTAPLKPARNGTRGGNDTGDGKTNDRKNGGVRLYRVTYRG
ncbi:DUF1793-domain-containing protein [Ophiobolus disseminans]|uniref:DUF1793-domain-containing protein n=1 Tax=Ophiobolus disseminans TaxID=1469910 RepID=A0A6A6ZYC4_9PLEO|nr:DUF1793-domain-containing protein [Ophiobolus disseminans]